MSRDGKSNVVWVTRIAPNYPTTYVEAVDETVVLTHFDVEDSYARSTVLSRSEARLLARRINQCLDETRVGAKYGPKRRVRP